MVTHQRCCTCKQTLPLDDFHLSRSGTHGRAGRCKPCVSIKSREWRAANPKRKTETDAAWYRNNTQKAIAQAARWKRKNPDRTAKAEKRYQLKNYMKIREKRLKKKYGIDFAVYDKIMDAQRDACAVCARQFGYGNPPQVDHCHATGAVRGILCNKCNKGLGMFDDSVRVLNSAIAYILQYSRAPTAD